MTKPRTHALDNLRTYLTVLVILHHAAVPYGGAGSWLYTSPHYAPGSSVPVLVFNATNQAFFMATFFLLSAYFSSIAARKRTRRVFLREKWKRLGVPTVVYSLVSRGLIQGIIAWRSRDAGGKVVWKEFVQGEKGIRGVGGPVWYCALLLIFDALYTVLIPSHFSQSPQLLQPPMKATPVIQHDNLLSSSRLQSPRATSGEARPLETSHVLIALCLTATSSFFIRMYYPVGQEFAPLCLQLGFVSQYILYYVAGIYIYRSGRSLESAISSCTIASVAAVVVGIDIIGLLHVKTKLDSGMSISEISNVAIGGPNIIALIYAFWNEFTGILLCSALLKLFTRSRLLGKKWSVFGFDVGKYSYAAFLVHMPLLVDLQCWFGRGTLETKGAVVVAVTVGAWAVCEAWVGGFAVKEGVEWVGWTGYV